MKFNINSAYKKLKSYVYQDNTLLHLKISLARFESDKDFETKLSDLEKKLKKDDISEFDEYFSEVNYIIVPKTYNFKNNSDTSNIYSNSIEQNSYEVRDFNVFIDCPIELHLLSILWIMYIGDKLDSELSDEVLGYRLVRNNDGIFEKDDYKLFKKYHEKYSSFRDGAVKQAINLHKIELDCSVINLDIKINSYVIQVNNAKYGDSRITQPTSTQKLDILKIKGGEDTVLMTVEMNIKSLREFQKKDYHLQKEDGGFKPTPPEFLKKCFKWRVK